MSTVVLYCWCHSDSASVLLYFTLDPARPHDENEAEKEEEDMFVRSCGIVSELYTHILRFILSCNVAPINSAGVARKIRNITSAQRTTAMDVENQGNYDACDFNLLYLFIVHGISSEQPANGWGSVPSDNDKDIGHDIERMRIVTEFIISQNNIKRIETEKYKWITEETLNVCSRIDKINTAVRSSQYVDLLSRIKDQHLDDTLRNEYLHEIQEMDPQKGKENFIRKCRIVLDLNPSILQVILHEQLPPDECAEKVKKLKEELKKKHKKNLIRNEQQKIIDNVHKDGYEKCDTSLMYILLRNICHNIKNPKSDWENPVKDMDISIGDDIERIRQRRNEFGHSKDAYLCSALYTTFIEESREICKRMDAPAPSSHSPYLNKARPKFLPILEAIEKESIGRSLQVLRDTQRPNELSTAEEDMLSKLLNKLDIFLDQQKDIKEAGKIVHKSTYTPELNAMFTKVQVTNNDAAKFLQYLHDFQFYPISQVTERQLSCPHAIKKKQLVAFSL